PSQSNLDVQDDWEDSVTEPVEFEGSFNCTQRWRNAGPEQRKKMFSVFDDAKYPLALMNRLLSVYGVNGGCAYDIGCAFTKTLANSSIGPLAKNLNLRMMVGAFHGHAHNQRCQLDWHPMYIEGTGLTEGEGCEHIFSSSNDLAWSTRHVSPFHRQQTIEEHFAFWDQDKYAALSVFLRNHYREVLTLIHELSVEVSAVKKALNLTDADFAQFHTDERSYLESLKEQPLNDRLHICYVQVLDDLAEQRLEWDRAREAANQALTRVTVGDIYQINAALSQARIRVDTAYTKLQHAETFTGHIEGRLRIEERWTIGGDEYNKYREEASLQKYRTALDELEHLVVMRLFELSKLSLSSTGKQMILHFEGN
ncbi:hypothetical protein CY34DRAFT_95461, partial [Suillus luteus UH-Slu-Lm8-n1]